MLSYQSGWKKRWIIFECVCVCASIVSSDFISLLWVLQLSAVLDWSQTGSCYWRVTIVSLRWRLVSITDTAGATVAALFSHETRRWSDIRLQNRMCSNPKHGKLFFRFCYKLYEACWFVPYKSQNYATWKSFPCPTSKGIWLGSRAGASK